MAPAAAPRPTPRRILVIEDNLDAAESLQLALELEGHEVAVAHDGPHGIERARELTPDVVLCDIGLPDMDGYAVAKVLRSEPGLRDTFLVALTGYALPEDRRRAAEAGFDAHLTKPVTVEGVEEVMIGAGLGRDRGRRPAASPRREVGRCLRERAVARPTPRRRPRLRPGGPRPRLAVMSVCSSELEAVPPTLSRRSLSPRPGGSTVAAAACAHARR